MLTALIITPIVVDLLYVVSSEAIHCLTFPHCTTSVSYYYSRTTLLYTRSYLPEVSYTAIPIFFTVKSEIITTCELYC